MDNFLERIRAALLVFLAFIIILVMMYLPFYKYKDCKKVGHTKMYCILEFLG